MLKARLTRFTTALKFPCHYQDTPNPVFKLHIFVTDVAPSVLLRGQRERYRAVEFCRFPQLRPQAGQHLGHPCTVQTSGALKATLLCTGVNKIPMGHSGCRTSFTPCHLPASRGDIQKVPPSISDGSCSCCAPLRFTMSRGFGLVKVTTLGQPI